MVPIYADYYAANTGIYGHKYWMRVVKTVTIYAHKLL